MAQRVRLDMDLICSRYDITESGGVWDKKREAWLSSTIDTNGYYHVSLCMAKTRWVSLHKLVASKYLGVCPAGCEISHKDGDKSNNHYTNLEYITHSENQKKAFAEHGRMPPPGNRNSPSPDTRRLMSEAKKRPVITSDGVVYPSIQDCADDIGYSRVMIYNSMKTGRPLKRGDITIKFLNNKDDEEV